MLHTQLQPVSSNTEHTVKANDNVKVINVQDSIQETMALLTILQSHNSENSWTLLLAPDAVPSKALLESLSIDHKKLLVIRQRHLINIEYVLQSALTNGNFGAVISWTNMLDEVTLSAIAGNQHAFRGKFYHFAASKAVQNKSITC